MSTVSVIVPIYNAEKYLGRTVNSILNQTFGDIELVLINDGSTDSSLTICRNFEALDERIKIIDKPNGGVSSARNAGLLATEGDYLTFVDSDDTIEYNMLEKMVEALEANDADMVMCNFSEVREHDDGKISCKPHSFLQNALLCKNTFMNTFCKILNESLALESVCGKLIKRDIVIVNHFTFSDTLSFGEDFLFYMQYYPICEKIVVLSDFLYNYHTRNEDSLTRKYKPQHMETELTLLRALENMLRAGNVLFGDNYKYFRNYCAIHIFIGFRELLNPKCLLSPSQKREIIREYLENDYIRDKFQDSSYMYGNFWCKPIRTYVLAKNERKLYAWFYDFSKEIADNSQNVPNPGIISKFFAYIIGITHKVLPASSKINLLLGNAAKYCSEFGLKRAIIKTLRIIKRKLVVYFS